MAKGEWSPPFEEGSRDERDPRLHFSTLHDQDDDESGNRNDDATGERIDNSTDKLENQGLTLRDSINGDENDPKEVLDYVDRWINNQDKKQLSQGMGGRAVDSAQDLA